MTNATFADIEDVVRAMYVQDRQNGLSVQSAQVGAIAYLSGYFRRQGAIPTFITTWITCDLPGEMGDPVDESDTSTQTA